MMVFSRGVSLAVGVLALGFASAGAQENLDSGKSPAQLFASDCAICHKSPQGLTKSSGVLGLDNFLREHYTASRESAAAIARYLQSMDKGPAAPASGRAAKKDASKGDDKTKGSEKKSGGAKSDAKSDAKPSEAAPSETKPAEAKPAEAKPADPKPSEPKPAETPKSETPKSETPKSESPKPESLKSD